MSPCVQQTTPSSRSNSAAAPPCALFEPLVQLHLQPERGGQRLDRLDAADIRAREDAPHTERPQELDELGGLQAPARIEGTQMVVVLPVEAVSGRGMAEQDARHSCSSSGRSRDQLRMAAARSGVSQRISSTSSCGANSPSRARIRQ